MTCTVFDTSSAYSVVETLVIVSQGDAGGFAVVFLPESDDTQPGVDRYEPT